MYEKRVNELGFDSVTDYQSFQGLTPDGIVGPVTERLLSERRFCSVPDSVRRRGNICKWPQTKITWNTTGAFRGIAETVDVFAWALSQWARVCGIEPQYSSNSRTANLIFNHGRIDGPSGTLAWQELPCGVSMTSSLKGLYDNAEPFVFSANPPPGKIDAGAVAAHEAGHGIGLDHFPQGSPNLLAPIYTPRIRIPQSGDIAEAVRRYGPPATIPEPEPEPDPPLPEPEPGYLIIKIPGAQIVSSPNDSGERG